MPSRLTRWSLGVMVTGIGVWVGSGVAAAHGVQATRFDAPVPLSLMYTAAGVVVAFTAAWVAVADSTPSIVDRVNAPMSFQLPAWPRIKVGASITFLGLVVAAMIDGAFGPQIPAENFATVFTWPVWIHGLAVVAILVGNPWPVVSPWHTIHRGLSRLEGRDLAVAGGPPTGIGVWPAVVGFVAVVGIIENLTVIPRSPQLTVVLIAGYALTMIGGSVLWGVDWLRRADPFEVFYRLLGRVAPVTTTTNSAGTTVSIRPPWQACRQPVHHRSTVVFVVAIVYTVSFDGFTNTSLYQTLVFDLRPIVGTGALTGTVLYLSGFITFVTVFIGVTWASDAIARQTTRDSVKTATAIAPTVLPIAAAYELAHNLPYVIRNVDQLLAITVPGVETLGLLAWLTVPVYWGTQIILITSGHIVAVMAAHQVLANRYPSDARTPWPHAPLVVLMVGYTVVSLWIISQPLVT